MNGPPLTRVQEIEKNIEDLEIMKQKDDEERAKGHKIKGVVYTTDELREKIHKTIVFSDNKKKMPVWSKFFILALINFSLTPMLGVPLILYVFGQNYFYNQKRSSYNKLMLFVLPAATSLTVFYFATADWSGIPVYQVVHFSMLVLINCSMLAYHSSIVHPELYDIMQYIDFDRFPELDINAVERQHEMQEEVKLLLQRNETIVKIVKVMARDEVHHEDYEQNE
jgi:hypothetical protein